ncbi:MAG: heme-binding domain-containing protein [Spirosomataceae bacterium]
MTKKLLLVAAVLILGAQLFQPTRNESLDESPDDIMVRYNVPEPIQITLKKACYDCHSNHTVYPWYSYVQPVGWWLNHHVEEGKEHLNFSEFGNYPLKKADHKLEEVMESQETHWMPMDSYTWMHPEAKLTEEERLALINWAKSLRSTLNQTP